MHQIKDAMTRVFVSISPDASVSEAIEMLLDRDISGVPVIDDGALVGMLTQFQLLEVLYDPELRIKRVRDFMTRQLVTVEETDMLARAVGLMVMHRIRRLPVLRGGRLVGIVSRGDLLRYFRKSTGCLVRAFGELSRQEAPSTAC